MQSKLENQSTRRSERTDRLFTEMAMLRDEIAGSEKVGAPDCPEPTGGRVNSDSKKYILPTMMLVASAIFALAPQLKGRSGTKGPVRLH